MTSSDSTAAVLPDDDVRPVERLPVITHQLGSSTGLPEPDSGTSFSTEQGLNVRPRRRTDQIKLQQDRERFEVLDNWEGVVTAVEGDSFFASMRRSNGKTERAEDEFEIDIDNVAMGDRDLVHVGAVFYLTVGIRRPRGEGPQKTTRVVFRRMPRWSSRDIKRAEAAATELWEKLHSRTAVQTTEPKEAR